MPVLRFVSLAILAVWVGGLIVLGAIVAPRIFADLAAADSAAGPSMAGGIFGGMFQQFHQIAAVLGAALIALLGARAAIGPRPRWFKRRVWIVGAMLAMTLAGRFVLGPRVDAIRRDTAGPIAALPDTDPRRVEFSRLHGLSNVLAFTTLAGGLLLIWFETKDG